MKRSNAHQVTFRAVLGMLFMYLGDSHEILVLKMSSMKILKMLKLTYFFLKILVTKAGTL